MKRFKIADFWISVSLMASCIAVILYRREGFWFGMLVNAYAIVGSWQAVSMIAHAFKGYFTQKLGVRCIYHWISILAVITIPIGSYWILMFASPFMAIFYTWLCYRETYIKMQRPLSVLK